MRNDRENTEHLVDALEAVQRPRERYSLHVGLGGPVGKLQQHRAAREKPNAAASRV